MSQWQRRAVAAAVGAGDHQGERFSLTGVEPGADQHVGKREIGLERRGRVARHPEDVGHTPIFFLASLAAEATMSRAAFSAAFREQVGDTPMSYGIRWRMQLAVDLLHQHRRFDGADRGGGGVRLRSGVPPRVQEDRRGATPAYPARRVARIGGYSRKPASASRRSKYSSNVW